MSLQRCRQPAWIAAALLCLLAGTAPANADGPSASAEAARDERLAQRISAALERDPSIGPGRVDVRVRQGTAILTGAVRDWDAYATAIETALRAGALAVVPRLEVRRNRAP